MLKDGIIEALGWARDAWLKASDNKKERAMVYIDALLDQFNQGLSWNDAFKKDMMLDDVKFEDDWDETDE
jgi:hypothetical protein